MDAHPQAMTTQGARPVPGTTGADLATTSRTQGPACRDPRGIFPQCPNCDSVEGWKPEHAHFRCVECGFRDSCCD